jgi:uncharacterized membrane protein YbhN (UPF0104 family)
VTGSNWIARAVGRRHEIALLVALAALLAVSALVGVAWAAGFSRVRHLLLHPSWPWLGAALAAEVVAYLGYTVAYREIVRADRGSALDGTKVAALVATGFGVFLQGGGFALDHEALKRVGLRAREARARVLGLGALEYSVLAPAAVVAAIVLLVRKAPVSGSLTLPWVIGVPVGGALALGALAFKDKLTRRSGWRARVGHTLQALELVLRLARSPRRHALAFVGIFFYWLGDIACLWCALHTFTAHTPVAQLIVGYASGYAITRRALPLGGAGVVEALLPFALSWVQIALAPALLAVIAYRLINLWLPMLPALAGLPALRRLERRPRAPTHAGRA